MPQRADIEKNDLLGVLRVLLTDACALCWRGRCSSRFPPDQAEPPCPASWGFWAASSWPADISAETCCTEVTGSAPPILISLLIGLFCPLFFFLTHKCTWTHIPAPTADFSFSFVLLVTHEAARYSCKMKSIKKPQNTPTYCVVVLSCSCQSSGSWMNSF